MNHAKPVLEVPPGKADAVAPVQLFPRWQPLPLAALIAYLYYGIVWRLVQDWLNDPNFSHGFIVPLFSAFLLWQKRAQLSAIPPRPSWFGLVVIAGAMGMLLVGIFGAELFLSRSSLLFLLAGLVIYFLGWAHFRAVLFPWLFLFLMIPIPAILFNQVTLPLQLLASWLATALLQGVGVPALREGNIIQLSAMPLEVADACSGIRSLMSLATLAIIYGYFLETGLLPRIALIIAAVPIAVAANGFRIVGTGLLVEHWDPQKALGFFHEFSGWVVFVLSMLSLLAVHRAIRWAVPAHPKMSSTK